MDTFRLYSFIMAIQGVARVNTIPIHKSWRQLSAKYFNAYGGKTGNNYK